MFRTLSQSRFRLLFLAAFAALVWWFAVKPVTGDQGWTKVRTQFALCGDALRREGCVIDGDTVLVGNGRSRRRIRLTGFDAPERDGACNAERELAKTATIRLHQWLRQGPFEWTGGDDPPRDQYGRELREARRINSNGQADLLAKVMISEGLAAGPAFGSGWGEGPRDWCKGG